MKGTGKALSDPAQPLTGPRGFNRFSAPDANSCAGCHNTPYGIVGGRGDFVANVFVQGQRFDFATFDSNDKVPSRGGVDERGQRVTLDTIGNSRVTTGLFGAGYIELLAREVTDDLQRTRDSLKPGDSKPLISKGISFGRLSRTKDGLWVSKEVEGLSRLSLITSDPVTPPSLVIRPWHQASNVVSLREFTNTAFNHHHGIQSTERFGRDVDPDGDGAGMQVPGRVIPRVSEIERFVLRGEVVFSEIGCARCHIPSLPLQSVVFWEVGNGPPYYHHGKFTTMRQSILAHAGEAEKERKAFEALPSEDRDSVIEFLKTLQVLPPGTKEQIVDEYYRLRDWPPARLSAQ